MRCKWRAKKVPMDLAFGRADFTEIPYNSFQLEQPPLRILAWFRAGWTCQQGVDPRQEVERGDFIALQQHPQPGPPFVHGAAFLGGQDHRRLSQTAADGELFACPFQPRLKIGPVFFSCKHAASGGSILHHGQAHSAFPATTFAAFRIFHRLARVCGRR